jgi:DNA-binding NtrC family response regulator
MSLRARNERLIRFCITGVADALALELSRALARQSCRRVGQVRVADIVFCSPERNLVEEMIRKAGHRPVIAVSGIEETNHWLDALEAGAADYCVAPFEGIHMRWILDRHCAAPREAAAIA